MDINSLIQTITPFYNQYKQQNRSISGTEALKIMWDIGDILKKFIEENKIAPHTLFWEVYGKSEGTKNIVQKSWITREFQGRCYRIRNIFSSKRQIEKELPTLKSFTYFRETLPFFDNQKYKLTGKEKEKLLELLNSKKDSKFIMKRIRYLQEKKIGIKNPRTQRLKDLEGEKKVFINFYNSVYQLLNEPPEKATLKLKKNHVDPQYVIVLAKNTNALSQDGLKFTSFTIRKDIQDPLWKNYGEIVKKLISNHNAVETRRFRRIIPAERIVQLADMLYSLPLKK